MTTVVRFSCRVRQRRVGRCLVGLTLAVGASGCHSGGLVGQHRPFGQPIIRHVACVYDQNPWLDLDRAGDLDVEGFRFRMFLDPGTGRGVLAEGTLNVEMYRVEHTPDGPQATKRTLVSDWHYPTSEITRIGKPGMLGAGYVPQFVWADKSIAGSEVDIVVWFEDADGNIARAGTRRLRIPKYER